MKKKVFKIIALILALVLIGFLCWFANGLMGNPLSKLLATKTAEEYIRQTYPESDFYMERIAFSFKDSCYHAFIQSPTSVDTHFSLTIDMLGKLRLDTYDTVANGWNTYQRLEEDYRALTDTLIDSPDFPYGTDIGYGSLEMNYLVAMNDPNITDIPDYALAIDDLIVDRQYDIRELGRQCGHLILYVEDNTITAQRSAQIMLDIRSLFDESGIPFRAMTFVLHPPKPEDGPYPEEEVRVEHFLYEDIYEEGMTQRVQEAHAELMAHYAGLDAKK